jgi:hypothetical protein
VSVRLRAEPRSNGFWAAARVLCFANVPSPGAGLIGFSLIVCSTHSVVSHVY